MSEEPISDFEKAAVEQGKRRNLLIEFLAFMQHNKKWWLLPVLVALLLFGLVILMSGTAAAPFIYTLF